MDRSLAGVLALLLLCVGCARAPGERERGRIDARFVAVVLGAGGGLSEGNLSALMLAPIGTTNFVCLDAGTVHDGILSAHARGSFSDVHVPTGQSPVGTILRKHLKAYVISHAHLDHVAGLVLSSTDDGGKPIYALGSTIDAIRDHLFNWSIWPNFGTEGVAPQLGSERYIRLTPGKEESIRGTGMTIEPFVLSHDRVSSTAFLIRAQYDYALYFGDVGSDVVEGSDGMRKIWERIAPLVRTGSLRGIFLEVSYPDGRSDPELFGHLTPAWMMAELRNLADAVSPRDTDRALRSLTVIVTHIKPTLDGGPGPRSKIVEQIRAQNDLGVRVLVPAQGDRIEF